MRNLEKQYYGPGGDFIPFSNVDYSNINDDRVAYRLYFMNEVVYVTGNTPLSEHYQDENGYRTGVIKGKVDRYFPGVGQVEFFVIESESGYVNLFTQICFSKHEFSRQVNLRKQFNQK
jgi:hypothetical protein